MQLVQIERRITGTHYKGNLVRGPFKPKDGGLRVIKTANDNQKLTGPPAPAKEKIVTRGPALFRGLRMYQVTLEEGATCPPTCRFLQKREGSELPVCYGANMPFAKRHQHGPLLEEAIAQDLNRLSKRHPEGYIVRLHVLGDFYSVEYVRFWDSRLEIHDALRLFGYTHWEPDTEIGAAVAELHTAWPGRVAFRRSDGEIWRADDLPLATTVGHDDSVPDGFVLCPNQTHGKTCLTCGLCFNGFTNVAFREH